MPNRELEGLYAEFHLHPVLQVEESQKQQRPIYKDEVYIKIQIKGQKHQIRSRKMIPADKTDFPTAWERWTSKEAVSKTGTPLSAIPGMGPSLELELNGMAIHTVEDLAEMTDAGCTSIRGGYMFRQRAQAYLAAAKIGPKEEQKTETIDDSPVDVEAMKSAPGVIQRTDTPRKRTKAA